MDDYEGGGVMELKLNPSLKPRSVMSGVLLTNESTGPLLPVTPEGSSAAPISGVAIAASAVSARDNVERADVVRVR